MPLHVQVGFLLPREAGVGQIFRRRAAANGHIDRLAEPPPQPVVGVRNRLFQVIGQRRLQDRLSHESPPLPEIGQVMCVQVVQNVPDLPVYPPVAEKQAVGLGGNCEAVGHLDAFPGQLPVHFPQRCVLSTDERDILDPDFLEPFDGGMFLRNRPHEPSVWISIDDLPAATNWL